MVREVNENELSELLELYLHLHEKSTGNDRTFE